MKNIYILIILIFTFFNLSFSQEIEEELVSINKFYIGVNASLFNSKITATSNLEYESKSIFSVSESLEIGYFFSKNVGISIGFGMSTYKTDLSLTNYSNTFDAIDSENDEYQMSVSSTNISENQKISYLDVPVSLLFKVGISDKIGFFVNPGIKLSFLNKGDYTGNGIFSYEGFYPEYNVTLHSVDVYGYPTNYKLDKSGELGLAKSNKSLILTGGVYVQFGKFNIAIGAYYDRSLGNISEENSTTYILSENPNNYNSLIGSSTKTLTQAIGGCISVKYFLR